MSINQEYISRISKGDLNAFESLFIIYQPRVKSFIRYLIKSEEDIQDLTQDVFLKLWNNRETLPTIQYFSTYLFRMSKNAVYDYYKQKNIFSEHIPYETAFQHPDELNLEHTIETRDLEFLIDTYVDVMPERQKEIFILSRKKGLSNEEISNQLKISKRTVETHISNALKELRKFISHIMALFF